MQEPAPPAVARVDRTAAGTTLTPKPREPILTRIAAAARFALCLFAAGCTVVGPNYEAPTADTPGRYAGPVPGGAARSVPVAEAIDPQWWKLLGDPTLTRLEERLAEGNLDLRVAAARLAQARAQLAFVSVSRDPTANANASYTRDQQSRKGVLALSPTNSATNANGLGGRTSSPNSRLFEPYDLFQSGFDVSWEIDLWGRVARLVESSTAQLEAAAEARREIEVTASAELARNYVQLRGVQRKLAITRESLASSRQSLNLTRERAAGGVTTDLDVANAAAIVESVAAQLPQLEARQSEYANAIALLLGTQPGSLAVELAAPRAVPPVPPRVPVGIPSELARRRPDIRRAEAILHAATADIGVATADFYPRVVLAGSGALQGLEIRNLPDLRALTYSLGPSISLPIFDGGRVKRTVELREAQQREAAILWQKTVLGALHDVDNALTAYDAEQRRRDRLEAAARESRRALGIARQRYEQGVSDFLQVLLAQRAQLAAEQDLADSTTTVTTNMVQLYKALGGGWTPPPQN